jgi:hypothetical protein
VAIGNDPRLRVEVARVHSGIVLDYRRWTALVSELSLGVKSLLFKQLFPVECMYVCTILCVQGQVALIVDAVDSDVLLNAATRLVYLQQFVAAKLFLQLF